MIDFVIGSGVSGHFSLTEMLYAFDDYLLDTTLFDDSASQYVLYDRHVPASWVWRKIAPAKQQTQDAAQ